MPLDPQDNPNSFNRPEFVRFDSLRDSKDLGAVFDLKAELCGFIGAEAGTQSLFFSFELLVPGAIQVQVVSDSKWTARFLSVGLRSETGAIGLDALGNARGVDIVNTCSPDEALLPFPPGKYTVVVGCSQWQTTPFCLRIRANPTSRLHAALTGRGGLGQGRSRLRIGTAKLEGGVTGQGLLRAPGSGLFAGRRDKPVGPTNLTGRGQLGGQLSIREPLRSLAGAFLSGSGSLGGGRSTPTSNQLGPRMWVSRLATLTETSIDPRAGIALLDEDYTLQTLYFLPPGGVSTQKRLALIYRAPNGTVLWTLIATIFSPANESLGWRVMAIPGGDAVIFSQDRMQVMRVRANRTIAWNRQVKAQFAAPVPGSPPPSNEIGSITDAVLHPGTGQLIFTAIMSSYRPAYIRLNPTTGDLLGISVLSGGTLQTGLGFNSLGFVNGPLVRPDGRLVLTGARKGDGGPSYTWAVECDANLAVAGTFFKYTDGTSQGVFENCAVLHPDGAISMLAGIIGGNHALLQLNPDLTIRRRALGGIGTLDSQTLIVSDADGTMHFGGGNRLYSRDQEGDIYYRDLLISGENNGFIGRADENSNRRPGPWFRVDTRWAVASSSGQNVPAGLANLTIGYELDMASTTVSGTGYSITMGVEPGTPQSGPVVPIVIQRETEVMGGGIDSVPALFVPGWTEITDTPDFNPDFVDASTLLTFEYRSSPIRRGNSSGFPGLRIKPDPAIEPDPLASSVSFHLPGSGVADSAFFVDVGPFNQQPIAQGGVRHSITQARFPDLGGFFEPTAIEFDGIEDALVYAPSPGFRLGNDNWTLEAWVYPRAHGCALFDNSPVGDPAAHLNSFILGTTSTGRPVVYANGTQQLYAGDTSPAARFIPLNTWTHVALSKEDQVWRIHVNGRVDASGWRFDLNLSAAALLIGRHSQSPTTNFPIPPFNSISFNNFNGFMADIRLTRGVARYHRNFQPRNAPIQYVPTGPPISLPAGTEPAEVLTPSVDLLFNSTLLLIRGNGTANIFLDDGPWIHTLIPFGSITQAAGGKWGGNRIALDGFGDYIDTVASPGLVLGTGDFTIELWATRTGDAAGPENFQTLIDGRTANPSKQILLRVNRAATGRQVALVVDGAIRILGEPMVQGTRYHIALVRSAGFTRLYMNGVQVGSSWADATDYTANDWHVGQGRISVDGDPWSFQGSINDVRILREAIYPSAQFPPNRPIGLPPTATARYWQLFDLQGSGNDTGQFNASEIALHQGRNRLDGITATSSSSPVSGSLALTQDLSVTADCVWSRESMEQTGAFIQLDAGAPVTVDSIRMASAAGGASAISGFSLRYSDDLANWTVLGHATNYDTTPQTLSRRIALVPLPTDPDDADFDKVSLRLLFNEAGAGVIDTGPRGLPITAVNTTKTTISSVEGGQSLWLSAASNAYLGLGGGRRSVFCTFGTGPLTLDIEVYPLTVPPVRGILYDTNAVGDNVGNLANGFQLALTSAMKLDVFINGTWRGASAQSLVPHQWNSVRLRRTASGRWEYVINGIKDAVTFVNTVNLTNRSFTIGRTAANSVDVNWLNAYIDRVVLTRGLARGAGAPTSALSGSTTGSGQLSASTLG